MTKADKIALLRRAIEEELLDNDPRLLDAMDEPLPAWLVLDIAIRLLDKVNPTFGSYD
ncbi:hypothetical protein [Gorillibacterium massiliense]|uniref:hypothetical protein n=1 Tax=Gorillibacterium massiliense TaxID=1280390 RepID=UPI0004BB032E|nr:hypothetical protein [Gorillibacterium massiliense]